MPFMQRQQLVRRKLRRYKPVKAKVVAHTKRKCCQQILEKWGESLGASEAVPDNHEFSEVKNVATIIT